MNNETLELIVGKVAAKKLSNIPVQTLVLMSESDVEYKIGKVAAKKLMAARRLFTLECSMPNQQIRSSTDAYHYFSDMKSLDVEVFKVLFMNQRNMVLSVETIGSGGYAEVSIDTRIIWRRALEVKATGIIIAHNHPSGNDSPSQPDINLTKLIERQGELMNIKLRDHIIVLSHLSRKDYVSFADEGYML